MEIYELVGAVQMAEVTQAWRQSFANAVRHFQRAEWDRAEAAFREVMAMRENDGPSRFYLREIGKLRHGMPRADWFGAISMEEK